MLLALLFAFVMVCQLRISLDTVRVQRSYEFVVPFDMVPFTSQVESLDYGLSWEQGNTSAAYSGLRRSDHIVQVNDRSFTGISVYLRELWDVQHQSEKPFVVTVLSRDSRTRRIEFGFPHCTCGIPEFWQTVALFAIAPVFCISMNPWCAGCGTIPRYRQPIPWDRR